MIVEILFLKGIGQFNKVDERGDGGWDLLDKFTTPGFKETLLDLPDCEVCAWGCDKDEHIRVITYGDYGNLIYRIHTEIRDLL